MGVINTSPFGPIIPSGSAATTPSPIYTQAPVEVTATSPPPSQTSPTNSVDSSTFKDLFFNKTFEKSVLNDYYQVAYHFRLFVVGDKDIIDQAGGPTTMADLASKLNTSGVDQVTIAESGVTAGYNIREVEFVSVVAQNFATREQNAVKFILTIAEPLGTSFLDGLFQGFADLGVFDFTKMNYYLELRFTGYKDDGSYAGVRTIDGDGWGNGGYWIWRLKLGVIETKLNEGGAIYKITMTSPESELVLDEARKLAAPQTLAISGLTLKDMFDAYTEQMNTALQNLYGGTSGGKPLLSMEIQTHPDPRSPDLKDIKTFKLETSKPDQSTIKIKSNDGKPTAIIPAGTSSNDFITSAIKATEEGQALIIDQPTNDPNNSTRTFREYRLFSIEPELRVMEKDINSGNYIKKIILHVHYFYSPTPIMGRKQVTDANQPSTQRDMITRLITNKQIKRRYDYIYTGWNTDVLDFSIDFNMAWQYALPRLAGARGGWENESVPPVFNDISKARNAKRAQADLLQAEQQLVILDKNLDTMTASYEETLAAIAAGNLRLQQERVRLGQLAQQTMTDVPTTSTAKEPQSRLAVGTTATEVRDAYIEDILDAFTNNPTARLKDMPIPISFWQHFQDTTSETGIGFTGPFTNNLSIVGATMAQIYGSTLTGGFGKLTMTIRGDPFWLGQTNIERQIRLRNAGDGVPLVDSLLSGLPDNITGRQVVYLHFQYPIRTGDDFVPKLVPSESFNGLYEITMVTHTFSDGVFKQKLEGTLLPLHDIQKALQATDNIPVSSISPEQLTDVVQHAVS